MDPGRGASCDGGDGRSFARGQHFQMIICKRPAPPDDHLQEAGPFGCFISERQVSLDDYLQEAGPTTTTTGLTGGVTWVSGVTRGGGTEGGKEEKGEGRERGAIHTHGQARQSKVVKEVLADQKKENNIVKMILSAKEKSSQSNCQTSQQVVRERN